jgi:hypothetical protein
MAQGDLIIFSQFKVDLGLGLHDLDSATGDTIKAAFVTSATTTPTAATSDPRWGAAGGTDFSATKADGGNFPVGGVDITTTYAALGADAKFDGTVNIAYAKLGTNPADSRWVIIYNDTDTGKRAIAAVDLGAVADGTAGAVNVTWNASGIFTVA